MINSTMNSNETMPLLDSGGENSEDDIKNYMAFKIKIALDQGFFPVFVPVGFVGNVLSFLVMTQRHNRHMSIAFYISVLAVTDNITLLFGLLSYLGTEHLLIPASPVYCAVRITAVFTSSLCGVYLILAMTFDRFYGIIQPHKASSFNTVRRAKITCFIIILVCTLFNIPHMFLYIDKGYLCIPYAKHMQPLRGEFYYWLSFVVNYSFPFVALLIMNSFIMHTIRFRKNLGSTDKIDKKLKTSERQIFMILLLVTFSFLLLTTPAYMFFLFSMIIDFGQSPKHQADLQLFFSAAQKTWYANNGINFFLYILSGTKFRNDFINLLQRCSRSKMSTNQRPSMNTLSSITSATTDRDIYVLSGSA